MTKYKAKILPNNFSAVNVGDVVPLINEHQVYGEVFGSVLIVDERHAEISADGLKVGQKLSAGSFVTRGNRHDIREVSLTNTPKFDDCEILEVIA